MAGKRNQHFVPQFYLRIFQSAPRRINLYDLHKLEPRKDVPIKGQCYQRDFHGKDSPIEDKLSQVEGVLAKTLQTIANTQKLPSSGSAEYVGLVIFACLQYLRTHSRTEAMKQMFTKFVERAYNGEVPQNMVLDPVDLTTTNLSMLADIYTFTRDLKAHFVISPKKVFITSDSPVVTYNQYCEGIRDRGVTGLSQKGIQVFVPLSSSLLLILYDASTYRIHRSADRRSSRTITDNLVDVDQLNFLQLLSAERNVYFSDWAQRKDVERLLPSFHRKSIADRQVAQQFQREDNPEHSLIVSFERMPNTSLNLSFMAVEDRANEIPLYRRPDLYRDRPFREAELHQWESDEGNIIFSRFIGES